MWQGPRINDGRGEVASARSHAVRVPSAPEHDPGRPGSSGRGKARHAESDRASPLSEPRHLSDRGSGSRVEGQRGRAHPVTLIDLAAAAFDVEADVAVEVAWAGTRAWVFARACGDEYERRVRRDGVGPVSREAVSLAADLPLGSEFPARELDGALAPEAFGSLLEVDGQSVHQVGGPPVKPELVVVEGAGWRQAVFACFTVRAGRRAPLSFRVSRGILISQRFPRHFG